MHQELEDSLIISEEWGAMQKQTEGKRYVTITRVDLLVETAGIMFTNVEVDMVKDKSGICASVSIPLTACTSFSSSAPFLVPIFCFASRMEIFQR